MSLKYCYLILFFTATLLLTSFIYTKENKNKNEIDKKSSKSLEQRLTNLENLIKQLEDDNLKIQEDLEAQKFLSNTPESSENQDDESQDKGKKKDDPFLRHPVGFEPKVEITGFAEWQGYYYNYSEGHRYPFEQIAALPKSYGFSIDANTYFKWHFHPWFSFFTEIKWCFADDNRTMFYNTPWKEITNPLTGETITTYARVYEQKDMNLGAATTRSHASHSLFIERMHLDFHPSDQFKIKLGKFLTPFGIWNVDHGAPALPTVNLPLMFGILRLIPYDQTGIEFYGNLPIKSSNIGYHAYVGNGQNNKDEQLNLDHNISAGGRLFFNTRKLFNLIDVTFGVSGYAGQSTFIDQQILVYNNAKAKAAVDVFYPHYATYNENAYKYDGGADIRLKIFDLEIIGEFFHNYVEEHTYIGDIYNADQSWGKVPNYHYTSYYIYAGYTFFNLITPYGRYDWAKGENIQYVYYTYKAAKYIEYVYGIRVRPYPFLVWKTEGSYRPKQDDLVIGDTTLYTTSISVAF